MFFLFSYRRELRRQRHEAGIIATYHQLLGNLYDVYFNNRDLKLLLNLLATRYLTYLLLINWKCFLPRVEIRGTGSFSKIKLFNGCPWLLLLVVKLLIKVPADLFLLSSWLSGSNKSCKTFVSKWTLNFQNYKIEKCWKILIADSV